MRKSIKIWLILAACLIVIGIALFAIVMSVYHWDFSKLNTDVYVTNTIEINDDFRNILIDEDTADITFAVSEDGKCRIVCYSQEYVKYEAFVRDDILTVKASDTRKWYEYTGFSIGSPEITVYLPQVEYASLLIEEDTGDITIPQDFSFESVKLSLDTGDVHYYAATSGNLCIKTDTGDICVKGITAGSFDLTSSTGDITVSDCTCMGDIQIRENTGDTHVTSFTCENLTSEGNTGDITLKDVIAAGKISIKRDTGDVKLQASDAQEICIKTDTGNVSGSLLTEKVFITKSDTGDINVPGSVSGGRCEISTDTGDIKIEIS